MHYRISGLPAADFAPLASMNDEDLEAIGARRVIATAKPGFPCRVSLEDADAGETLILLHHVSHDVATPYRSAYAIYVRQDVTEAAHYADAIPPVLAGRSLGLRGFDASGMLRQALLALPGEAEEKILMLLADETIAYIDAHNAAHGCFAARIERSPDA